MSQGKVHSDLSKGIIPRAGFTIVELLIVVVVIAILAAITVVAYNGIQTSAVDSSMKADLRNVATTLEVYKTKNGAYPADAASMFTASGDSNFAYKLKAYGFCASVTNPRANAPLRFRSSDNQVSEGTCESAVTTLAGSGAASFADGMGVAARFNGPYGVAVDSSGVVYVADGFNARIRKISPSGEVTTLAGSGSIGSADGIGTVAQFKYPTGVAVDSSGFVYVADNNNSLVRKVSPSGVVTTLAGSAGVHAFADGTGVSARFRYPTDIAVDPSGTVYVADSSNHRIRKISPSGVVTTLAGSGTAGFANGVGATAQFNTPSGIAVDSNGIVYVADYENHRIRKILPNGEVTTFAGLTNRGSNDGTISVARFSNPQGVAVDSSGVVYVTDFSNHRIRKVSPAGEVTTLIGSTSGYMDGVGSVAQFNRLRAITVSSSGMVYVADSLNHRIRMIEQ